MLFPCLAAQLCCTDGAIEGLQTAGRECSETAVNTRALAADAYRKGETAVKYSVEVKETLASFGGGSNIGPDTFHNVIKLVQDDKAKQTLDLATEMDDMAATIMKQAIDMTAQMQRGIDSLPEAVRDELQQEEEDAVKTRGGIGGDGNYVNKDADDDDMTALTELLEVDSDIDEVERSSRNVGDIDIFTAAVKGRDAYESVAKKEVHCQQIFGKMQKVCDSVVRIAQALAGGDCLGQTMALAAGAPGMFKCIRLTTLLQKAAEAARKLIQAVIKFVRQTWNAFKNFAGEFEAAKRLGRFVNRINPFNRNNNDRGGTERPRLDFGGGS